VARVRFALLLLLVVATAPARAESPFVATVGLGVATGKVTASQLTADTELGGGLLIDVGYRVHPSLAIGVHVAATYLRLGDPNPSMGFVPIELGLSAQYVIAEQVWIAPSIGIEDDQLAHQTDQYVMLDRARTLALGLAVGVDLARDRAHRVGLFGALAHSSYTAPMTEVASQTFTALIVGVAVRYW
jgi:hypothetical protein